MKLGLMAPVVTLHSQIAFPIITSSHPKKRVLPEAVSGPGPEPLGAPDQLDELRINQGPRSGVVFGTVARGGKMLLSWYATNSLLPTTAIPVSLVSLESPVVMKGRFITSRVREYWLTTAALGEW